MYSKQKALFFVSAVLLIGLGCNLLSLTNGVDPTLSPEDQTSQSATVDEEEIQPTPVPVGGESSPGNLEPGASVVGAGGVVIEAEGGAIDSALSVWIEETSPPDTDADTISGTSPVGTYFRIGATSKTYTSSGTSFFVGVPVPGDADPETLRLGVLESGQDILFDTTCEGEECPDEITYEDTWTLLQGQYDEKENLFFAQLPLLSPEGRVIGLFTLSESATQSQKPGRGILALPVYQQGAQFEASCLGFAGSGVTCNDSTRSDVEDELSDAYSTFSGLGFADPHLQEDSDGTFLVDLRPNYTSTDSNDNVGLCELESTGVINRGRFSPDTKTLTVCIPAAGVTTRVLDTSFHEYFHATQYGYSEVRDNPQHLWILEGTASASENSVNTMARDTGRSLHDADIPLTSSDELYDYEAQDFWVYLGLRWNEGFDYLIDLFERGANTNAVDVTLQQDWPDSLTLGDAYWDWVRNQTFEKQVDLGNLVLGVPCQLAPNVGGTMKFDYNYGSPPGPQSIILEPLDSVVLEINFQALSTIDYSAGFAIDSRGVSDIRSKVYPDASNTTACQTTGLSQSQNVSVDAGQNLTYYALVSNTSLHSAHNFTLTFTSAQSGLNILEPADGTTVNEGDTIDFLAVASGLAGGSGDLFQLNWYYTNYQGTQISLGSSENGAYHPVDTLCDGTYQVTAEAINASTSETVSDTLSVTVNDLGGSNPPPQCAPEVTIVSPRASSTFRSGDTIQLQAAIDDDHPETNRKPMTLSIRSPGMPTAPADVSSAAVYQLPQNSERTQLQSMSYMELLPILWRWISLRPKTLLQPL